jgi:hypothetical protein
VRGIGQKGLVLLVLEDGVLALDELYVSTGAAERGERIHDGAAAQDETAGACRGSRTVKVVPSTAVDCTCTVPPCAATMFSTM